MKNDCGHHWIAFCVGYDEENKRVLASCLTFWARNRFFALKAIEAILPEHDNWTRTDGTTRPHQLWRLEQCPPGEAEHRAFLCMQAFCDIAGIEPPTPGMVA